MEMTVMEPRDGIMVPNQYGARTFGLWCLKEVKRVNSAYPVGIGDARYIEERIDGVVHCRIDRIHTHGLGAHGVHGEG